MRTLEKNITNQFGDQGKRWLKSLPTLVEKLSAYWELTDITPFDNLTFNYVAKAVTRNQCPVVIKVSCNEAIIEDEIKALQHFNGHGAIRLLDIQVRDNAMLLEQAITGQSLKKFYPKNKSKVMQAYQTVINQLSQIPITKSHPFKTVSYWLKAFERIPHRPIPDKLYAKAVAFSQALVVSQSDAYLLHADLHHDNIVSHQDKWLAIDPKGLVGEKAFEAAAFDFVDKSEYQTAVEFVQILEQRANELAVLLDIDLDRLLKWTYVRLILSALWWIEDGGDPSESIEMANALYSIFNK